MGLAHPTSTPLFLSLVTHSQIAYRVHLSASYLFLSPCVHIVYIGVFVCMHVCWRGREPCRVCSRLCLIWEGCRSDSLYQRERERAWLAGCTTVMDRVGGGAGIEWQGMNDRSGAQTVPVMKGPPSEEIKVITVILTARLSNA